MFSDKQFFILLGIAAGGGYLLYQRGKTALNPADPGNLVYQGANDVTRRLTGRDTDQFGQPLTLGTWLYNLVN